MARFFSLCLSFLVVLCALTPIAVNAQVINEFVANHEGASPDPYEFVEIFGSTLHDYSNLTIVEIEGDISTSTGTIGRIDQFFAVGTTDVDGFWKTAYLSEKLENGSLTLLLVNGFTGAIGDDVDGNNDGVMDTTFWTGDPFDQVSIWDDDPGDGLYGTVVLSASMDSNAYAPGGASRIPNGADTDTEGDWLRNNFFGDGLPGMFASASPGEAYNTPGSENTWNSGPTPVINEFVLEHFGTDDYEYIEVFGMPGTFYLDYWVVVIDGDQEDAGHIDNVFQVFLTGSGGAWSTGFLSDNFEGGSTTILLVKDFTGAEGDDLEANTPDGVLDVTPWSEITDSIAVTDGDSGDFAYGTPVLDPNFDGMGTAVLGASRIRSGINTDAETDWIRNDFDGAGLDGIPGSITGGEAYNTSWLANRVTVEDYYAAVDDATQETLRTTVYDAIKNHIRHEYDDAWGILKAADEDPGNSSNVLTVYKNSSVPKSDGSLNREHTWPKSLGFPEDTPSNSPFTDCHMLMLADSSYNSSRSNRAYGTCSLACEEYPIVGGATGIYPGTSNWGTGTAAAGTWEAWIGRRGDVARAQLYMDLRYEGGVHGFVGSNEPDLVLTDDTGLIDSTQTGSNEGTAYMGRLSVLLQWAAADPVSAEELTRNEEVYKRQGNRNPFVDHPEWVTCIFEGTGCGGAIFVNGFEDGTTGDWSSINP